MLFLIAGVNVFFGQLNLIKTQHMTALYALLRDRHDRRLVVELVGSCVRVAIINSDETGK
jgi:hypothetical protein